MSDFVFEPAPQAAVAVRGTSALFPARRVYCVGRNYAAHAVEMGHDPNREPPFFFMKTPDALLPDGATFPYPPATSDVHHEIEMVVALSGGGVDVAEADALGLVFGYGVGIDFTRRDLQAEAKKLARPWEVGKAFDHAAPCGALARASEIGHPTSGAVTLDVNGARVQEGDLNQLIWTVPEMISGLSRLFELRPGDLIFTGTPSGVGPVRPGDRLEGAVAGVGTLSLAVG
ncbi:fumarylacetoacetate hydrolase family protein [Chenggangzhangella methanolivorans]|uniref:Fumarylacetoacetate hydrolase family protein n=1 Tax=Chenggangzhangella methanolivorans TaxID=1437009 RepID=A0A9E6RA87_9HYPH|nr:fumarylacetoacetate hydrolase family protein [Chenggangzhangella methanolivorans]QZO01046.1 fumarylacetoacetate hydrolase family protein [Chenggangzhangella methanolivorans]